MISDLILSIFAFQIFFQTKGFNKLWSLFFLFMGFSALIGGIYHGFPEIGEIYRYLSWSFLSLSLIYAQLAAYQEIKRFTFKYVFIIKSCALLITSIIYGTFTFMIIDTAVSMFGLIVLGNVLYLKSLSNYITIGILISFISAFFVIAKISFHPQHLNYNDIGHYITILSLFVMAKGVRKDYYLSQNKAFKRYD